MRPSDPQVTAPILVAFSPESARPEPIEFGLAAGRLTGTVACPILTLPRAAAHPDVLLTHADAPQAL